MTETLLDTKEVLQRLRIGRTTLYDLMKRGKIRPIENDRPFLNKRAKLLFREEDVERLLRSEQ